ncbi:Metal-sulfur cluster biosynthetic enzyme [Bifidobacterium bohemicum]|uniref:FeS assembly SUF system domain protein n=1 Tax=Bifidobacterium bohemicum DSM 22767 TaxID=1437606 RepID=A0A086ZJR0_9BIFI|nr:metal-sulfur cluster assembly factor [Bifidobacterium bohemicum]KFI46760.1 FeS assembly SUF system domain protein [Bifidobacterium bohemicum DSM 22767]SCB80764.1 Metal-sulfur cluster biosynthetic enzyme [Bifidobacterium bohemicum]
MTDNDNLVSASASSMSDVETKVLGSQEKGRAAMINPQTVSALGGEDDGHATEDASKNSVNDVTRSSVDTSDTDSVKDESTGIPLIALDDIGRATAADVSEALHQVIDPELGIDVVDLGLVYGVEIDEQGRAIITMTLTTPACPLTDLLEDEAASALAGLVEEFRIDWTWQPRWTIDMIRPEGREQLESIGFNFDNMPKY